MATWQGIRSFYSIYTRPRLFNPVDTSAFSKCAPAPLLPVYSSLRLLFVQPPCAIPGGNKKAVPQPRPCLSVIISLGTHHGVSLDTIERDADEIHICHQTIVKPFSIATRFFTPVKMVRVIEGNVEVFLFFPRMDEITGFSTWFYSVSLDSCRLIKEMFCNRMFVNSWILVLVR